MLGAVLVVQKEAAAARHCWRMVMQGGDDFCNAGGNGTASLQILGSIWWRRNKARLGQMEQPSTNNGDLGVLEDKAV